MKNIWTEPKETVNALWTMACNGQTEKLKEYYENGGKTGCRYNKFGTTHSLIAGAWRNGWHDTVKYLLQAGEDIEPHEAEEIDFQKLYLPDVIRTADDLIDYFRCHSENLTEAQMEKITALSALLKILDLMGR